MFRRSLIAAALVFAAAAQAQTVEVAGRKFPATVQVGSQQLALNGAGVRHKFVVKVYAAGLYLPGKASTPEQVYSATGPRRLHVTMLRDIDANEFGKLFTDGMQKNATREEFGKAIAGTVKLGEIFSTKKRLVTGESFDIDYVPGVGTMISVNGKLAADPIREPEFFTTLMKIWLGHKPADDLLKDALLGKQKPAES